MKKPTKKAAKKTAGKKRRVSKGLRLKRPKQSVSVTRSRNAVTISYDRPVDAIPHFLEVASKFADEHFAKAAFTDAGDDVLGTAAARAVVSTCANSECWGCTLADLKLDSDLFQTCVYEGVQSRGYEIDRNQIPASQTTQLYTVVMAIQDAPRRKEP